MLVVLVKVRPDSHRVGLFYFIDPMKKEINYNLYEVGGAVRDSLLGIPSKDIDFTVVINNKEDFSGPAEAFEALYIDLVNKGYEVFLKTPEMLTIRAKFPKDHKHSGLVADFVLARKELGYDGITRRPEVTLGTLKDDLERRDFTVNAMAFSEEGELIDFFGGKVDLRNKLLKTPGDPLQSFTDDPLRILRGVRFKVTKGLELDNEILIALAFFDADRIKETVSVERIREELIKSFKHSTIKTLDTLFALRGINYPLYESFINAKDLWLEPTTKS